MRAREGDALLLVEPVELLEELLAVAVALRLSGLGRRRRSNVRSASKSARIKREEVKVDAPFLRSVAAEILGQMFPRHPFEKLFLAVEPDDLARHLGGKQRLDHGVGDVRLQRTKLSADRRAPVVTRRTWTCMMDEYMMNLWMDCETVPSGKKLEEASEVRSRRGKSSQTCRACS